MGFNSRIRTLRDGEKLTIDITREQKSIYLVHYKLSPLYKRTKEEIEIEEKEKKEATETTEDLNNN